MIPISSFTFSLNAPVDSQHIYGQLRTTQNLTLSLVHNGLVSQPLTLPAVGDTVHIRAVAGNRYLIADADAKNTGPALLVAKRMSNAIALGAPDDDGPRLIIDDYYLHPGDIIGQAEDGSVHVYVNENDDEPQTGDFSDGEAAYLIPDSAVTEGFASPLTSDYSVGAIAAFAGLLALSGGIYALQNKHSAAEKKTAPEPENTVAEDEPASINTLADASIVDEMTQPLNSSTEADELALLMDDILANAPSELFPNDEDVPVALEDNNDDVTNIFDIIADSVDPHDLYPLNDVTSNTTTYQAWHHSGFNTELTAENCVINNS